MTAAVVPATAALRAMQEEVVAHIVAVRPSLAGFAIDGRESLTGELGLDSLDLVALADRLRAHDCGVDMQVFLTGLMAAEVDSVAALAGVLADTRKEQGR